MRKRFPVLMAGAVLVLFSLDGLSQDNWLQKGKDLLGGFGKQGEAASQLSTQEIGAGLKEALRIGTEAVVAQLGKPDGFNADPAVRLPLPDSLKTVRSALSTVGMSASLDDLEVSLNRAAETATPKAKELFWSAIAEMSLDDVNAIYHGPDDAATRYFQEKMTPQLSGEMQPLVDQSLAEVGAIKTYDTIMNQYQKLPLAPDVEADLTGYVIEKSTDGIFHYLAIQEAEIRKDPARQTTELLQRVFGGG
jgi:hypothetical protein